MQALKSGFVLVMLLLIVFPVLYSAMPLELRTPFDVKIELIARLSDGFEAFPSFPSPPSFSNPLGLLRYVSSFLFFFGSYIIQVITFFTHNIRIGIAILSVLLTA